MFSSSFTTAGEITENVVFLGERKALQVLAIMLGNNKKGCKGKLLVMNNIRREILGAVSRFAV